MSGKNKEMCRLWGLFEGIGFHSLDIEHRVECVGLGFSLLMTTACK